MAKNYKQMALEIVACVGGEENVMRVTHCMTRLRFVIKDDAKVRLKELKQVEGVIQVIVAGGQYQVVIGTHVGDVYDAVGQVAHLQLGGEAENDGGKKKNPLEIAIDIVSGIFMPFMGAFMGAGLLKGILMLCTTYGLLDSAATTYTLLNAMADGVFVFLPIFLAHTAGIKFGASPYAAMAVAAAIVYPDITALFNAGASVTYFGVPVTLISYTSSVVPIIVAVFFQAKLEKFLKVRFPKIIEGIVVPLISLVVTCSLTFVVIGPVTNVVATGLANGINWLLGLCPPVAGFIFAMIYPVMIIFGLHWGILPISLNNFATLGGCPIMAITTGTNFGMAGAALGVSLKTKNVELKQIASSSFISALVAGVVEPALYGCVLKYKKPFVIVCLCNAVSGAILATSGAMLTAIISTCVLTIPTFVVMMGPAVIAAILISFFGSAAITYLFGFDDSMIEG